MPGTEVLGVSWVPAALEAAGLGEAGLAAAGVSVAAGLFAAGFWDPGALGVGPVLVTGAAGAATEDAC